MTVSAWSTAVSPATPESWKKPECMRTVGVGEHRVKSYQSTGSSGLRRPKSSVATPISNGLEPAETIITTRCEDSFAISDS